ncbi:substrate-binding domain-containing protein [Acetanaerobacterium elongatum]|uniref:Simple sugar transport system substrate-binding protein n=1 Tax=Acetanaerobacterium elongatum TaxID=258515 RepID=A0A1H0H192_9FIRM|nr:substrate-binding domain-containing protein [Acetanaerobacterium elongatum]SDO12918.1 simple sugar transport system substrate-binding protein [Acetanaerobacterium elongatum]
MKKLFAFALAMVMALSLTACGGSSAPTSSSSDSSAEASGASAVSQAVASSEAADGSAGASGKIAVIRQLQNSDHTVQFFAGCVAEGEALGYSVDTFSADGDDVKMQDLMEQALQKDYKIWIISHANEGYQKDLVSRAVAQGIKVVGFDCGGDHVDGVTYTSQDDKSLAKLSLDALIEKAKAKGATEPINIIEINILGMIVPFDTRHAVIEEYEKAGKLKVVDIISPKLGGDTYSDVNTAISTDLTKYPAGQVNGIWAASSAFLDGAVDAINDAGRNEMLISAVDISDTEIQRLVKVPQYICCACVDPYVIGTVDVRLAVLKTLGVETPETYALSAVAVTSDKLTASDTMKTLNKYFPNFGSTEDFNTKEIKDLRAKFAK